MDLRLSDFDYPLDSELIAQVPAAKRDESRLMVLTRSTGQACHHVFRELPGLLREEDLLVLNDTL
ncbi:MAG TPA: S-adenosylmethionine:tRNA ribosyltransferase-isomerase, partial [Phycisphaerae bacterium]|nr:S-adenosylmethionine:tRNA ribosyltransferase-isomerase [Phycisphaerae bacterium]